MIEKKAKDKISFASSNPVFTEMKKRVKVYFDEQKVKPTGNIALYTKAIFWMSTYIGGYIALLFVALPGWLALLLCAYLGMAAAAIGFNIMHDGSHGSFSDKKWINQAAAYCINILGGDAMLWKNKHIVIHHTYTNIEGYDQDIAQLPVLRLNSFQKKYAFHNHQHWYCFLVYGLSSILWMFLLDFMKYFSKKVGNIKITKITQKEHLTFWITKIYYCIMCVALPVIVWGWPAALLGFFIYHFMLGITISTVFQLAHVVEETDFPESHFADRQINDEWAVHQLKTTANFATKNALITSFVGGLNFQVEHHLFPRVSHIHYPAINKIVKEVCAEYKIPYHEFPTFWSALQSHIRHLKQTARDVESTIDSRQILFPTAISA